MGLDAELQRTIADEFSLHGVGLHTGQEITMTLSPAAAGSGIIFKRTDIPGEPCFKALARNAEKSHRGTNLKNGDYAVCTVEHFLAACTVAGVDNILVTLNGPELPAMDGSARPFYDALTGCGTKELKRTRNVFRLKESAVFADERGTISATPADSLTLSYTLLYEHPHIGYQFMSLKFEPESLADELLPARTFCLESEVESLRSNGLGLGGSLDNAVIVGDDGILNKEGLRFPDEFVRHKLLDMLGDLSLAGGALTGHFHGIRSGHVHNVALVQQLIQDNKLASTGPKPDYIDIQGICEIIPHRFPFLLVDRIVEMEVGKRAVGIKNVSINEPFFQGHFPSHPVMPGVLMVEAMAQVAGVCILSLPEHQGRTPMFTGLDKIKFRRPIVPGDQVRMEIEVTKIKGVMGHISAKAFVDDKVAVEGVLKFTVI